MNDDVHLQISEILQGNISRRRCMDGSPENEKAFLSNIFRTLILEILRDENKNQDIPFEEDLTPTRAIALNPFKGFIMVFVIHVYLSNQSMSIQKNSQTLRSA